MKLTQQQKDVADKIIELTIEEAKELPNMLGQICSATLKASGFYGITRSGVKTLYILK